jgi:TrmH family RNA methyltransferase
MTPREVVTALEVSPETRERLARIVVVLSHPQDLVNVAAVIRAMKNMGLERLRLVKPDEFDSHRIGGIAHRTEHIVEGAEFYQTLAEAVADAVLVIGTTARARTAGRNYMRPRQAMPLAMDRASEGTVALVFGREDRGLSNEELDLCEQVVIIPTDPDYSSLNLAQAALILMYELFLEAGGVQGDMPRGRRATRPATLEDREEMYGALEQGLERIEFFKARKAESVLRTLRTILGQAELDLREARLIRAIGFEIGHYLDRQTRRERDETN